MLGLKKFLVKIFLLGFYPFMICACFLLAALLWPLFIFVPVENIVGKDFFDEKGDSNVPNRQ